MTAQRPITSIGAILLFTALSFPASAQSDNARNPADELRDLREAIAGQQKQLSQQQQELEKLHQQLNATRPEISERSSETAPRTINTSLDTPIPVTSSARHSDLQDQPENAKSSPLSFRIGGAEFTPSGFVDFTSVFRSTNVGSGFQTSSGTIPFSNTVQGRLSELRLTAQNSRLILKVTEQFGHNNMTGYMEMDFGGNQPANVFVTSNSQTNRLRLYWLDLKRGKWEFLAGQSWGWLAPNRIGLSPYPSDVFTTMNLDSSYQSGLTQTRAAQFRVAYHPNENWAFGIALENPEQFLGANEVTFPSAFNAALGAQFDANNNTGTPNLHPDIIPKIAYDTDFSGKHFHAEAAGLLTSVKVLANPASGQSSIATGGGVSLNLILEVIKNFRLTATSFYSDGGGRYIGGLGPDAVVRPDGTLSLVRAESGTGGFEYQITNNTLIAGYFGGAYFQRNFYLDTTSGANPKPFIGFGAPQSSNSANRALQQGTFDFIYTFWRNPQYGALQLITQFSHSIRSPWFVAPGTPRNAHVGVAYVDLRYVLP
jgi:hypothetical protein